jgi:hypothetical protein
MIILPLSLDVLKPVMSEETKFSHLRRLDRPIWVVLRVTGNLVHDMTRVLWSLSDLT